MLCRNTHIFSSCLCALNKLNVFKRGRYRTETETETERDTKEMRQRERSKQYRNLRWLIQLKNHVRISNLQGRVLLSFQRRRQPGLHDRGRRGPGGYLTVTRLDCLGLGSAHLPHFGLLRWSDWHFRSIFGLSFILKGETAKSSYPLGSKGNHLVQMAIDQPSSIYWAFPTPKILKQGLHVVQS